MSDECEVCGITAADLSAEGVDPNFWLEPNDDGVVLCQGCHAIQTANQRFADGDW